MLAVFIEKSGLYFQRLAQIYLNIPLKAVARRTVSGENRRVITQGRVLKSASVKFRLCNLSAVLRRTCRKYVRNSSNPTDAIYRAICLTLLNFYTNRI
jgi:hypothetical protein